MHPELSSLTSTITSAKERITRMADSLHDERDADLQAVLTEVERAMGSLQRLLEQATRLARGRF